MPVDWFHDRRSGTPLTDIRQSPTWQFIHEQELAKPIVHNQNERTNSSPEGYLPTHPSTVDGHEHTIQSQTFRNLMTSLLDHPAC